jgi:hypothetical protein
VTRPAHDDSFKITDNLNSSPAETNQPGCVFLPALSFAHATVENHNNLYHKTMIFMQ